MHLRAQNVRVQPLAMTVQAPAPTTAPVMHTGGVWAMDCVHAMQAGMGNTASRAHQDISVCSVSSYAILNKSVLPGVNAPTSQEYAHVRAPPLGAHAMFAPWAHLGSDASQSAGGTKPVHRTVVAWATARASAWRDTEGSSATSARLVTSGRHVKRLAMLRSHAARTADALAMARVFATALSKARLVTYARKVSRAVSVLKTALLRQLALGTVGAMAIPRANVTRAPAFRGMPVTIVLPVTTGPTARRSAFQTSLALHTGDAALEAIAYAAKVSKGHLVPLARRTCLGRIAL